MKNKINQLFILVLVLFACNSAFANQNWLTQGEIDVVATGTIESFLPPDLHRLIPETEGSEQYLLDLTLNGPDGKSRAFELFWREASQQALVPIKGFRMELKDDHQLLWEGDLPKDFLTGSIQVKLPYFKSTARLKFDAFIAGKWINLDNNIAAMRLAPGSMHGLAEIAFEEKKIEKLRIYFSGFDQNFNKVAINSVEVYVSSRKDALGFKNISRPVDFEEVEVENHKEIQIRLPGSGLFIESLKIETTGLFQGNYKLGYEKIVLGKRKFSSEIMATISGVDQTPETINIDYNGIWKNKTMVLQLDAKEYYGEVTSVVAQIRLPRLAFVADFIGIYTLKTGLNKPWQVSDYAKSMERQIVIEESFTNIKENLNRKAEDLLQNISLGGGPFKQDGFTWKARLNIEKPGFYQLEPDFKALNSSFPESFRIVKDGKQVPFFPGRNEFKETTIEFKQDFNAEKNESIFNIKLPAESQLPLTLKLETNGIFERTIILKKHKAGQVSWQHWKTLTWKNSRNTKTELRINLVDFPKDQRDLRLIIQNKNNQSLKINSIVAIYPALDLFFIAKEPGEYYLYGGNQHRHAPDYDLAMVQHKLFELFPTKISHEELEIIKQPTKTPVTGQDRGGPFDPAGYTWVASFSAPAPGLTQVVLNRRASLDDYKKAIRIVKNGFQIPYFIGQPYNEKIKIDLEPLYDQEQNKTTLDIALPQASKSWQALEFLIPGIFERKPVFLLRKPGKLGWKKWKELNWQGTQQTSNLFSVSLAGLPHRETDLRIEIDHGDNSPVVFTEGHLVYKKHDLFFNAESAGTYQMYGGNSDARPPEYDISLIRDQMLKKEPQKVILQETKPFSKIAFGKQIEEAFSEKGWGLYFVLGLVTLILVVVIIKIFPEEDNENKATSGPEKNSEPAKEETESPNNDKEKNPEKSE
jgi:hypothetical protein